jgi:hypothetical protein
LIKFVIFYDILCYSSKILKCWPWLISVRQKTIRSRWISVLYIWVRDLHCIISSNITTYILWPEDSLKQMLKHVVRLIQQQKQVVMWLIKKISSKSIFFGGDSCSSIWDFKVHGIILRNNRAEIRSVTRWLNDRTSYLGCVPKLSWAQACRISPRVYQACKSIQCSHEIYSAFLKFCHLPRCVIILGPNTNALTFGHT